MQNIKAIVNNHKMDILHQNNEIKDQCNCKNKKYYPLGGNCLLSNIVYQEKQLQPNPTTMTKFTLELWKSHSETTPNPLLMKVMHMQMTQNCRKNTGKLKGTTLFQK